MSTKYKSGNGVKLRPQSKGTILVFNTVQHGMFKKVTEDIEGMKKYLEREKIYLEPEFFVCFGPFDNIVRFDVDDYCLVNRISSLHGVSSQQIQCAYTIRKLGNDQKRNPYLKPFFCITQLKIQNHLILGCGPEIEEAVAELLISRLQDSVADDNDLEIEIMAALGWEEFFIFIKNSKGYKSLFTPILEKVRGLTLSDLEDILKKRDREFEYAGDNKPEKKHLFLSTYTTPGYNYELSYILEEQFLHLANRESSTPFLTKSEIDFDAIFKEKKNLSDDFGSDRINVSTRLSIKPGHLDKVRNIINIVLDRKDKLPDYASLFSIGRYDIYPWLSEFMSCKEFVILFELLRFSLGGNCKRKEEFSEILKKTQYYNSFTIVSIPDGNEAPSFQHGLTQDSDNPGKTSEGTFVSKLESLCLGQGNGKSIHEKFDNQDNAETLLSGVPNSIVIGLKRIFALFDSCIMDRFTCDSFLDMYPFMKRLREIIDTIQENEIPGALKFSTKDSFNETIEIVLQETRGRSTSTGKQLVDVFHSAIQLFYKGFSHRYLASYPMMDKNETGVDFSGRLHRILSAVTGMQNLLLDDLNCHLKKGFNIISTYPNIRIHRGSFNVCETNVFHLFQAEIFYSIYHEIMHTFIFSNALVDLRNKLNEMVRVAPIDLSTNTTEDVSLFIQEIVGDVFLLKNAFTNDFKLYSFWYWLLILQSKKEIDSHILLRYLLLSATVDKDCKTLIYSNSETKDYFKLSSPEKLMNIIDKLIEFLDYPQKIKSEIIAMIEKFYNFSGDEKLRKRVLQGITILLPAIETIYPLLDNFLEKFSYPQGLNIGEEELYDKMPLQPENLNLGEQITRRQPASTKTFRCILDFMYQHRKYLICSRDSVLNFSQEVPELRIKLFDFRIALINTLHWESLKWKEKILIDQGINFPIQIKKN